MSNYTNSIFDTSVGWENTGFLGDIEAGEVSEFYVKAYISTSTVEIKYTLSDGTLPTGLTLNTDGTISGFAPVTIPFTTATSTSTDYNFTIYAEDNANNVYIGGEFTIKVNQTTSTEYTDIFAKPLLAEPKRSQYRVFVNNSKLFKEEFIYRPLDSNFGVQKDLKVILGSRIENANLTEYAEVLNEHFYRQRYQPNELKTAIVTNPDGTIRYEVIYLDIKNKFDTKQTYQTIAGNSIILGGVRRPSSLYGTGYKVSLGSIYCPSCVGLLTDLIPLRKPPTAKIIQKTVPKTYIKVEAGTASTGSIIGSSSAFALGNVNLNPNLSVSKSVTGSNVFLGGTGAVIELGGTASVCGVDGGSAPGPGIVGTKISLAGIVGNPKPIYTRTETKITVGASSGDKVLVGAVTHGNLCANGNSTVPGGMTGNKVLMGGVTSTKISLGSVYGTSICDTSASVSSALMAKATDVDYYKELENQPFIPICYTIPGKSKIILENIKNSGIKFNTFDFDIDRIYIQNPKNVGATKYLLLNRNLNRL